MKRTLNIILCSLLLVLTRSAIAQPDDQGKLDGAFDKHLTGERQPIPYDNIREADVFWQKRIWRDIDFREKINLPFTWPKDPFVQLVYDAVMSGEIKAYSPLYDDFRAGSAFTIEQLKAKFESVDTFYNFNEETYAEDTVIVPRTFDYQTVHKIKLKEDWIFDEETSTMVCRIIGIALIRDRIDPTTGDYLGTEDMFWVYYPDLRDILVKHEVFNTENDYRFLTYDDIFEARMFSSYIVKEENPYDRYIENYAAGIDQVLEGERIKNEIFDFEHNLWEY